MHHIIRRRERSDRGFTLIELLVVLSLIMILVSLSMNNYRNSILTAKEATLKSNLYRMRDAIDQYYADKGQYPASIQALVTDGYLRAVPMDTITNSTDTWTTVAAEPDPSKPTADPGIYDIKSGSDAMAMNGTRYADW
ncbi:MAG TPA: prepilin-type N-terminal cleavage/methylation domain-containing protein [Vicinamibacterales bacterium]|nr:prepilin-type N-terminal cleavage/methylation domain-containing protein [Vicinamibacterales bacterium]